jgi:NAD(P)-dependent dehydrogenase (short-subunit alcohol dehydrogenase family)
MSVLAGRVALVTGASGGIGAALAADVVRYLLHTGDNVKLGPEILLRTMRNPMGPSEEDRHDTRPGEPRSVL